MNPLPNAKDIALLVASGRTLDYITVTYGTRATQMRYPPWLALEACADPGDYLWPVAGQRVCIECVSPMLSDDVVPLIEALQRDGCATIVVLYYRSSTAEIIDGARARRLAAGKALSMLWSRRAAHHKRCGLALDYDEALGLGHDGLADMARLALEYREAA